METISTPAHFNAHLEAVKKKSHRSSLRRTTTPSPRLRFNVDSDERRAEQGEHRRTPVAGLETAASRTLPPPSHLSPFFSFLAEHVDEARAALHTRLPYARKPHHLSPASRVVPAWRERALGEEEEGTGSLCTSLSLPAGDQRLASSSNPFLNPFSIWLSSEHRSGGGGWRMELQCSRMVIQLLPPRPCLSLAFLLFFFIQPFHERLRQFLALVSSPLRGISHP